MVFSRRAVQNQLNGLRTALHPSVVDKLVARLNQSGKDHLAAMWEVAVCCGLSKCGDLRSEEALLTGRRPDVFFENDGFIITADVTTVSDESIEKANPHHELLELIEKAKVKLGLPRGGVELRIKSKLELGRRGGRVILKLPPRKDLQEFVRNKIIPALYRHADDKTEELHLKIDDGNIGIELKIDYSRGPISYTSYGSYDMPLSKNRNPLFNALKSKASQLRTAEGLTGVIVCDGGCAILAPKKHVPGVITASAIALEFLRQYSSIDFVLLIAVQSSRTNMLGVGPRIYKLHSTLVVRPNCQFENQLCSCFDKMLNEFPEPVETPVSAALRVRENGYGLGHYGEFYMKSDTSTSTIRLSSRELMETLAGIRRLDDNGAINIEASRRLPPKESPLQADFLFELKNGRLPSSIRVIKTDDNDSDDWVEFEFSEKDPSISPFK